MATSFRRPDVPLASESILPHRSTRLAPLPFQLSKAAEKKMLKMRDDPD